MERSLNQLTDAELFSTRLRIDYYGFDHNGNVFAGGWSDGIIEELTSRGVVCMDSLKAYEEGLNYVKSSNFEEACKCFNEAIRISSRFLDAYTNLGGCLIDLNNLQSALEILTKGKKIGLTFDLAKNRAKALIKNGGNREQLTDEISFMLSELFCAIYDASKLAGKAEDRRVNLFLSRFSIVCVI